MTKELLQEQLEILDRTNMHKNAAKERVITHRTGTPVDGLSSIVSFCSTWFL